MSDRGTPQERIGRANDTLQKQFGFNQTRRNDTGDGNVASNVNAHITPSGDVGYLSLNQTAEKDDAPEVDGPAWMYGNTDKRQSSTRGVRFEKGKDPQISGGHLAKDGAEQFKGAADSMDDYFSGRFQQRMGEKMKKLGNYDAMPDLGKRFRQQPQQQVSESRINQIVSETINKVLKNLK